MERIEDGPRGPTRTLGTFAFLAMIATGPLCFLFADRVKTTATPEPPEFEWRSFRTGVLTARLGQYLKETSPVTGAFRGRYNDARFHLGIYETGVVHIGRAAWMFLPSTLELDLEELARRRPARMVFLRRLREVCDRLDVRLLAVVVPDKARVYADLCYADGLPSESTRGHFATILAELDEAGIERLDLATRYATLRDERPDQQLYFARDSHWTYIGVWNAAASIRDRLAALGWDADLGPRVTYEVMPPQSVTKVPDIVRLLGFQRDGSVERSLTETMEFIHVREVLSDGSTVAFQGSYADASLAVAGDSFAHAGLPAAVAALCGARVDGVGSIPAKGPFAGLIETLGRIKDGELRAHVVVWEFVERSHAEYFWSNPPTLERLR